MSALVHLVKGDDPTLRDREAAKVIEALLGSEDRTYALEDFTVPAKRGADAGDDASDTSSENASLLRQILNALGTPPFMTAHRVVVVREIGNLAKDGAQLLAEYVTSPAEGTYLVAVAGGGRTAAPLEKALKSSAVKVIEPKSEKSPDVLHAALKAAKLSLTREAANRVVEHVGDDPGRVPEIVELLASAFGRGQELDLTTVEPYLGEQGTAGGPWKLTDAIDAGDVAGALEVLHRMMHAQSAKQPKALHPMQLMGTLSRHYETLARLDDPSLATDDQAGAVLGQKPWMAGRRLKVAQRLGSDGIREAFDYLSTADVDLRGGLGGRRALPDETVMEILVTRLATLTRRRGGAPAPKRR